MQRLVKTVLVSFSRNNTRNGVGLRLAYWVAQVCNADTRHHHRGAKDGWRAGEVVEESDSGAEKNRRDVDANLVEEASIQALLDGVCAVDPDGLPGGGGSGLVHGALDAVGHEVDRRVGSRPPGGDVVGKDERGSPTVISAPALGDVERASAGEHGAEPGRESADVLGARPGHPERHGVRPSGVDLDVPRGGVPVEHLGHAVVGVGDVAIERHGHDCDNLRHGGVRFERWRLRLGDRALSSRIVRPTNGGSTARRGDGRASKLDADARPSNDAGRRVRCSREFCGGAAGRAP